MNVGDRVMVVVGWPVDDGGPMEPPAIAQDTVAVVQSDLFISSTFRKRCLFAGEGRAWARGGEGSPAARALRVSLALSVDVLTDITYTESNIWTDP